MKLEDIATQVRPRNKWQAIDLGFKMASIWYWPLFIGYIAVSLPLVIVANLFLQQQAIAAALLIWWLKPLWERIQLTYISHALFGQKLTFKQQYAMWLQSIRQIPLAQLTYRRLSLSRSYRSPIMQLERAAGAQYTKRVEIFEGNNNQAAKWLTIVLIHLEVVVVIAMVVLYGMLIPEQSNLPQVDPFFAFESTTLANILSYLSMAVVAPFFVCSGFSLYLNQRTQIEGWDIEISFKRLLNRIQSQQKAPVKSQNHQANTANLIALIMLSISLLAPSPPSVAEQPQEQKQSEKIITVTTPEQQQAKQRIETILNSETFSKTETQRLPEFLFNDEQQQSEPANFEVFESIAQVIRFISSSIEWLLTLCLVILAVLLAIRYRDWLKQFLPNHSIEQNPSMPKQLFGLSLPDEKTIQNAPKQAQQLLANKQKREALSLLYRASLQRLIAVRHIVINQAFTEGECVDQVKQNSDKTTSNYFSHLTHTWQLLAYANTIPKDEVLHQLITSWSSIFDHNKANQQDKPNED